MKNHKGQPICGKAIEGPSGVQGRNRPLWRDHCRRVVKVEGQRCWQHKDDHPTTATTSEECAP